MHEISQNDKDIYFMTQALRQAKKAFEQDEVPVGAVLVHENKVVATGYNQVEMLRDATAHAEMICLTAGSEYFSNWRLIDATLYCSLEPCCMCAGAMHNARIKRIVWGAEDLRLGASGSWINVFEEKHPMHEIQVTKNVLAEESAFLMKSFFEKQRSKKKLLSI